jgi:transcriptional regulator with XRE-family HTH domain
MSASQSLSLRSKMLGAVLREARLKSGLTQRQAAEVLGISPSTFGSYEHGRKSISLPELEILAYTLDLPIRNFWDPDLPVSDARAPLAPALTLPLRNRMIGVQLRLHRQARNLTLRDLAERTGFPPGRLSAYERGARAVPLPELEALAAVLGHTLDEYSDRDGPVGRWMAQTHAQQAFAALPPDIQAFVANPANQRFLRLAMDLSQLPPDRLRAISRAFQDVVT